MRRIRIAVCVVLCFCASSILAEPGFVVVARTGQPAPAGSAVSYDVLGTPFINTSGQVAFGATLAGPMANATNNSAIFVGSPVAPDMLVRSGMTVASEGSQFTLGPIDFGSIGFNAEGHALFGAPLNGAGIDPSKSFTYWLATPASLLKVASADSAIYRPLLTAGDLAAYQSNDGVHVWSPANPNPPAAGASIERAVLSGPLCA